MISWRTTLIAIVTLIASVVATFGIHVTQEVQNAIVVVGLFLIGLFARDATADDE